MFPATSYTRSLTLLLLVFTSLLAIASASPSIKRSADNFLRSSGSLIPTPISESITNITKYELENKEPLDASRDFDNEVTCFNSGWVGMINEIEDASRKYCETMRYRNVYIPYGQELVLDYWYAIPKDPLAYYIRVGYRNAYGDRAQGWLIKYDECMNWLGDIRQNCGKSSRQGLVSQGGNVKTTSGPVFYDPVHM